MAKPPSISEIVSHLQHEIDGTEPHSITLSSEVLACEYLSSQVYRDIQRVFPKAQRVWVAYFRRQDELAISRYAEHIKKGTLAWPDGIRHVAQPERLDHRLRLERIAYAVTEDKIGPVSFDSRKRDLMEGFFEASGITPPSPLPQASRAKKSLPWRTLYCLR